VQWAYFPPFGRRSQGGSQTSAVLTPWLAAKGLTNAHYGQTFNNHLVLIVMVETIEGVKNAAKIAQVPGVHGVFAASGDLGNFSGWAQATRSTSGWSRRSTPPRSMLARNCAARTHGG